MLPNSWFEDWLDEGEKDEEEWELTKEEKKKMKEELARLKRIGFVK